MLSIEDLPRKSIPEGTHNYGINIRKSSESPSTVRKEYQFPLKTIFIIKQINLQQRLRNDGVIISFTFETSDCDNKCKLIVQANSENETYVSDKLLNLMSVIDHCGNLSKQICQYLARYSEIRDLINQKLQELNIDAGVTYINQSVSVVAVRSDDHGKAILMIQEAFNSKSIKLCCESLHLSQNTDIFLSEVRESILQSDCIWLEVDLDSQSSTCIVRATGPRKLVSTAIQMIAEKRQDYELKKISISDICSLKTEYIRLYRKQDILALEKKYYCQIEIETIKDSESVTPQLSKAITVKCYQRCKDEVNRQIQEIIDSVIIEKDDSISLYSRIGRLYHCSKNTSKLEHWQEEFKCLLICTDHQGNRYIGSLII